MFNEVSTLIDSDGKVNVDYFFNASTEEQKSIINNLNNIGESKVINLIREEMINRYVEKQRIQPEQEEVEGEENKKVSMLFSNNHEVVNQSESGISSRKKNKNKNKNKKKCSIM